MSALGLTPRDVDALAGCRCGWADAFMIEKLSSCCPIAEHRDARADAYRPRRIARELLRDVTGALKRLVFWGA